MASVKKSCNNLKQLHGTGICALSRFDGYPDAAWLHEEFVDCQHVIVRILQSAYRKVAVAALVLALTNAGLFAAVSLKPIQVYGVTDTGQVFSTTPFVKNGPFTVGTIERDQRFIE